MSHSNRHQFQPLEKNSKPLSGQRMARLISKQDAENRRPQHLQASLFVSVPVISAEQLTPDVLISLKPHILKMLIDAQDAVIREYRLETGHSEIGDEEISIGKCIAWLDEAKSGGRLTKEYLQQWFMEAYESHAAGFIAAGLGIGSEPANWTDQQATLVVQKIAVLRDMWAGWASGKYQPAVQKCKAMEKFAEYVGEDERDERMIALWAKTASYRQRVEAEMSSDALGF